MFDEINQIRQVIKDKADYETAFRLAEEMLADSTKEDFKNELTALKSQLTDHNQKWLLGLVSNEDTKNRVLKGFIDLLRRLERTLREDIKKIPLEWDAPEKEEADNYFHGVNKVAVESLEKDMQKVFFQLINHKYKVDSEKIKIHVKFLVTPPTREGDSLTIKYEVDFSPPKILFKFADFERFMRDFIYIANVYTPFFINWTDFLDSTSEKIEKVKYLKKAIINFHILYSSTYTPLTDREVTVFINKVISQK